MSDNALLSNGITKWMQDELVMQHGSSLVQVNSIKKTLKVLKKRLKDLDTSLKCQHEIEVTSGGCLEVARCKHCEHEWFF